MPHRFHVETLGTGDRVPLGAETVRHLHVLGMSTGDEVVLFDGTGAETLVRIESLSRTSGEACVLRRTAARREAAVAVTLACAVPRGRRMDTLVRMCAELGVRRIVPLLARRSVVRPDDARSHKLDRWRKICVAAAEQSGRSLVTTVETPTPLSDLVDRLDSFDLAILLSPDDAAPPLPDVLRRHGGVRSLLMMVGPEGGFTSEEVGLAAGRGATVARLTGDTLRIETASVVASGVVTVLFGDAQAPTCDT